MTRMGSTCTLSKSLKDSTDLAMTVLLSSLMMSNLREYSVRESITFISICSLNSVRRGKQFFRKESFRWEI